MIADPIAALVALLQADADIAALVDQRVFGGELPAAETQFMPRGAIVLDLSGGVSIMGRSYVEADTQRFDLTAWGATPAQAALIAATAALALRRARRAVWAGTLIHWVQDAGGSQSGRDSDTQWPFSARSFQVLHALEAVA